MDVDDAHAVAAAEEDERERRRDQQPLDGDRLVEPPTEDELPLARLRVRRDVVAVESVVGGVRGEERTAEEGDLLDGRAVPLEDLPLAPQVGVPHDHGAFLEARRQQHRVGRRRRGRAGRGEASTAAASSAIAPSAAAPPAAAAASTACVGTIRWWSARPPSPHSSTPHADQESGSPTPRTVGARRKWAETGRDGGASGAVVMMRRASPSGGGPPPAPPRPPTSSPSGRPAAPRRGRGQREVEAGEGARGEHDTGEAAVDRERRLRGREARDALVGDGRRLPRRAARAGAPPASGRSRAAGRRPRLPREAAGPPPPPRRRRLAAAAAAAAWRRAA